MPKKILVVHDKPVMLRLIQHHLEKAGYELIKARNAQEAMQAVSREMPELVVVGDTRAATSATDALREMQHGDVQSIPVIRMTDVPPGLRKENEKSEIVFTRPFSPTQLVAEVKRLVSKSGCESS